MQTPLRIELLGGLRVRRGTLAITRLESRKAAVLLAYIAIFNQHAHPREALAELLWPEENPDATQERLRQALSAIRRVIQTGDGHSPPVLLANRSEVSLSSEFYTTDAAEFESAARDCTRIPDPERRLALVESGLELYAGELMPGYYEDWINAERNRLAELHRDVLAHAASARASIGDVESAIRYARRAVAADPLREDAHCALMRLYVAAGRVSDAIRQYHELERALREGLALSPSAAAQDLLRRLREGAIGSHSMQRDSDAAHDGEPQSVLEPEGGAVPLDSTFYILRPGDAEFDAAVARRDSIVLVKGARQMGKTSLLARGLEGARNAGSNVVLTDLQKLTASQLQSADSLFLNLAEAIAEQLNLDLPRKAYWNEARGWNVNFERFIRREVLERIDGHVVWAIDELDRLFGLPFCAETLGLFRSWHNERALNPAAPWSRLTLAIAYATEAHLFISDLNQSPFNVGTRLTLRDLTLSELAELNRRYGHPLRDGKEVARYYDLVGGHPYLVRRGLHAMAADGLDINSLVAQAGREDGTFGDHLRRMYSTIRDEPSLCGALRTVIAGGACPTEEIFYRLRSAGLLAGTTTEGSIFRCKLYRTFFEGRL